MSKRDGEREDSVELQAERLVLRRWRAADLDPLAALTADPRVMGDLPASLSRTEAEALAVRNLVHFDRHGFGLWAIELPGQADFIGFAGLWRMDFLAPPFQTGVEIGWRLAVPHWGQGYATEAGERLLRFAFDRRNLDQVVGFTASANERSRRVMEKLGMRREPGASFHHPQLPSGHPLGRQLLYRIDHSAWQRRAATLRPAS